jgi:hypothetical protein
LDRHSLGIHGKSNDIVLCTRPFLSHMTFFVLISDTLESQCLGSILNMSTSMMSMVPIRQPGRGCWCARKQEEGECVFDTHDLRKWFDHRLSHCNEIGQKGSVDRTRRSPAVHLSHRGANNKDEQYIQKGRVDFDDTNCSWWLCCGFDTRSRMFQKEQ